MPIRIRNKIGVDKLQFLLVTVGLKHSRSRASIDSWSQKRHGVRMCQPHLHVWLHVLNDFIRTNAVKPTKKYT